MKSFFEGAAGAVPGHPSTPEPSRPATEVASARIAVYDRITAPPRVEDVSSEEVGEAIERLASRTYELAREHGGTLPYTLIREVAENLIHAAFSEVVVTIMDDGNTVRFADQGPGIPDKDRAFLPGFSTATRDMKRYIRGVGSGLPLVRECLSFAGGTVVVEDNLAGGTVVTLRGEPPAPAQAPEPVHEPEQDAAPHLSHRHKQVLSLVMEFGAVGPSLVADELAVAVSTAYRDLEHLESLGLISTTERGKRELTELGVSCLDRLLGS